MTKLYIYRLVFHATKRRPLLCRGSQHCTYRLSASLFHNNPICTLWPVLALHCLIFPCMKDGTCGSQPPGWCPMIPDSWYSQPRAISSHMKPGLASMTQNTWGSDGAWLLSPGYKHTEMSAFLSPVLTALWEVGCRVVRILQQPRGEVHGGRNCSLPTHSRHQLSSHVSEPWKQIFHMLGSSPSFHTSATLPDILSATSQETLGQNCPLSLSWIPVLEKLWQVTNIYCF